MTRLTMIAGALGAVALAGLATSGCATKKYVNQEVGQVDARVTATDRTARDALERATAAGKLAEGKFMYQVVLSDDTVKFPLNRWALSPEAEGALGALAERLKSENRNVYVEIQGHTDASGPAAYNDQLGADRAEAVRRYLNRQGVALNRMSTISYGEEAPVAGNDSREGRAQNRRVVMVVLS